MAREQTPEAEEYLETMVRLRERGEESTVSSIASELGLSKASVSQMLRKLRGRKLVKYARYSQPELTQKGEDAGKAILRKHRLIHRFLDFLGISRSDAHKEACALEHAVSDKVGRRLERIIEHGRVAELATLGKGMEGCIARIETDRKTAQRLRDMGLTENARVTITQSAPFKGPLELYVRGTRLAVGRKIALKIFVRGVR